MVVLVPAASAGTVTGMPCAPLAVGVTVAEMAVLASTLK